MDSEFSGWIPRLPGRFRIFRADPGWNKYLQGMKSLLSGLLRKRPSESLIANQSVRISIGDKVRHADEGTGTGKGFMADSLGGR